MKMQTVLVNNTNSNITGFTNDILNSINTGSSLPEELADLFNLTLITVDGYVRGILTAA
jgi:hypothetical protein